MENTATTWLHQTEFDKREREFEKPAGEFEFSQFETQPWFSKPLFFAN